MRSAGVTGPQVGAIMEDMKVTASGYDFRPAHAATQRFVDGKYARFVRHGAMLGYVLDGDTDRAMKNVENNIRNRVTELRMDKSGAFRDSTIRPDDPLVKETHHRRRPNSQPLAHFFPQSGQQHTGLREANR